MPERFIFRQVFYGDLPTFLADGVIRSKNHPNPQSCHQTSYQQIVDRRGSAEFQVPCGGVVNDYVPFYFSPKTSFTYTIHKGNVPLVSPDGMDFGVASDDHRIFFVCKAETFRNLGLTFCFSDFPLNSLAPMPSLISDLDRLEEHVHWDVFDEDQTAKIVEIGYEGVCSWFHNTASPPNRQLRSQKRMAEFLVAGAVPLGAVECIIAKTDEMKDTLTEMMNASAWNIPIYTKRGCYF